MLETPHELPPSVSLITHRSNRALLSILSTPSSHRPALPPELILQILSYPSRWVLAYTLATPNPIQVSYVEESKVLIRTPSFTARSFSLFRKVIITFCAKDQGWSSFPQHHRTFENSWTWFDLLIEDGTTKKEEAHDYDDEEEAQGVEAEQKADHEPSPREPCIRKQLLQANRHAGKETERYEISMNKGQGILQTLKVGDRIALVACARYSGWTNYVEKASMEIWEEDDLRVGDGGE